MQLKMEEGPEYTFFQKKKNKIFKWPIDTGEDVQYHKSSGNCKLKPQWDIIAYKLGWSSSKRKEISATEDGEKRESLYTVGDNKNW